MKLRNILAGLMALALIVPATPADAADVQFGHVAFVWDADSTSFTFPLLLGRDGTIFGGGNQGQAPISAANSTTVTATTALTAPFALVSVGDVIEIRVDNTVYVRTVIARADADGITISGAAITVTAVPFQWYKLATSTSGGWFDVTGAESITFYVQPINIAVDAGGVDLRADCKGGHPGAEAVQVYPAYTDGSGDTATNLSAEGFADYIRATITGDYASCRIGIQVDDDDAVDTTTAAEEITIGVAIRRTNR